MKRSGSFFLSIVSLCGIALLPFAALSASAQQQEDLSQKIQPQQKVRPNRPAAPGTVSTPRFKIGEFTVIVDSPAAPGAAKTAELADRSRNASALAKDESGISGQGHILLRGKRVPVSFHGVAVAPGKPGQVPAATAGTVSGTSGPAVEYEFDRYHIKLERQSIRLTPERAAAAAVLSLLRAPFMAAGGENALTLSSGSCGLAPDGAISGDDFRGPASFTLRDSVYELELPPDGAQSVHLGRAAPGPGGRPKPLAGCVLQGRGRTAGTALFSFQGTIDATGKAADFTLVLSSPPLVRIPEAGYELTLKSGSVRYTYGSNGSLACDGEFDADLKLPQAIKRFDARPLQLRNLKLRTDESGALFNRITMPDELRAGFENASRPDQAIFLIAAIPDAVWVNFPKWQSASPHSSYPWESPGCQSLLQFLEVPASQRLGEKYVPEKNVLDRPGVTILQGILYFKAAQATITGPPPAPGTPAAEFNLKTEFWGGLTLTPWGIAGTVTSSGRSFVPSSKPIEDCSLPSGASRPGWHEILMSGAARPAEPAERFRLAGLRILEMLVDRLSLCKNAFQKNQASIRYIVHFPFPSFVDLDFDDRSLDARGLFAEAAGPMAAKSWIFPEGPTEADVAAALGGDVKKGAAEKLNPDTQILWAWRLPVTFADRGVAIRYPGAGPQAEVRVAMKPFDRNVPEIMSSEIWVRPLFSRNSGIKAGLRFAARLDPDGSFLLTDWDTEPFFGRLYASPGTESRTGFECRLKPVSQKGIVLADAAGNPATRTQDLRWDGSLRFPFFGARDERFQDVVFVIRNLVPDMPAPIAELTYQNYASSTCRPADRNQDGQPDTDAAGAPVIEEVVGENPSDTLTATIRNLRYSQTSYPFQSTDATTVKNGREIHADLAYFSSFTCAEIRPPAAPADVTIPLRMTVDSCSQAKQARHVLRNAVNSRDVTDLVCYDHRAYVARGLVDACCQEFWLGTYEVSTGPAGAEKIILSAPNAKWYYKVTPVHIYFDSSGAVLSSDEMANPHKTFINIPGAGLMQEPNGALVGSFGATMTSLASSLPYEGEFRFYLDSSCGFFYLLSAGSFTYYLRFSGSVFIVNAPYRLLKRPPSFIGETQMLETLSVRALFPRQADFEEKTGLKGLTPDTVVSGVFTSGNASKSFNIGGLGVGVALGTGLSIFQFRRPAGNTEYCFSFFQNGIATASVAIASATAKLSLARGPVRTGSLDTLEEFFRRAEIEASGTLLLCACADIKLGHLQVTADGAARFSTAYGLRFDGTVKSEWGAWGCSPCR